VRPTRLAFAPRRRHSDAGEEIDLEAIG
jgi:hypothetical protein